MSAARSPAISGKDMARMKALAEEEREEERKAKSERKKQAAKAGKRKAATPTSSSCGFKTISSEEEVEPAEKIQATKKCKKATQKVSEKVPSKKQTARKSRGKRSLDDSAPSSMPPPATGNVSRTRGSVLPVSTSASNTSVGANVSIKKPTPDTAHAQMVSSSSDSDTQPAKKENINLDVMIELNEAATKEYPHIPAVMNIPLIKKIHELLPQEVLEKLSVRDRLGGINPAVWKITEKRFRCDLSRNEAHSYAYLLQNKELEVSKKEVQAKVNDLRSH